MYMYAGGHGRFDRGKRKIEANRKPKAESRAVILSQDFAPRRHLEMLRDVLSLQLGGNTTDRS